MKMPFSKEVDKQTIRVDQRKTQRILSLVNLRRKIRGNQEGRILTLEHRSNSFKRVKMKASQYHPRESGDHQLEMLHFLLLHIWSDSALQWGTIIGGRKSPKFEVLLLVRDGRWDWTLITTEINLRKKMAISQVHQKQSPCCLVLNMRIQLLPLLLIGKTDVTKSNFEVSFP